MKIAVLLTTYNRKEKTLSCLRSLKQQVLPAHTNLEIFLTDDDSKDGTAAAVKQFYPEVNLFNGTGNFFWAGGMRFTWKKAMTVTPDYYLLLNDDTLLHENAISVLLATSESMSGPSIIIGSTADSSTGQLSYGGWKLKTNKFWGGERVYDDTNSKDCDFGNANILLVSKGVVERLGILADHFTHSLADYDYTLKAKKAGFAVSVAPGFLGHCTDDHGKNWKSQNTSISQRIAYLKSPKGLAYKEYLRFIRDHFPLSYPSAFVKLWAKTLFPFVWDRFKRGNA